MEQHQQNNEHNSVEHAGHNKNWYDKSYKWILIIPALMLICSIAYLVVFNSKNGDIIYKDVSLTGGTTITVFDGKVDTTALKESLKSEFPDLLLREISDIRTGKNKGFSVETKSEVSSIKAALEKSLGYDLTTENSSVEFSGASLSSGFYKQLRFAILLAFGFMAIVVFLLFRTFIPSFAVILAAFADIVMTLAVVDISGMKVSTAGIIAFLMLIGYSVDTDILLTTRVLKKREGTVNERISDAFKTGLTMTLTAIAAVGASLIVIYSFSETLRQIFSIILIGLGFDIFNTWVTNASILKWYAEAKDIQ